MYKNGWDDLLYNNSVDLTVTGHFHVYSRTCPVYKRACMSPKPDGRLGGPVHITTGWGGPQSYSSMASPMYAYMAVTNGASTPNGFLRVNVSRTSLDVVALAVSVCSLVMLHAVVLEREGCGCVRPGVL